MSEHHRGAWGGAGREDAAAVWWPGAITSTADAQQMHQHLLNQQHQQQLHQQQLQQQQQQLQQNTSQGQTQQIFTYKMASSFQNPSSTAGVVVNNSSNQSNASNQAGSGTTVVASSNSPYDYRLNMANMLATAAAARQQSEQQQQQQQQLQQQTTQWWYANQQQQNLESAIQQHQQQQQNQHNIHNVHTPPPSNQHIQQQSNQQTHQQQQQHHQPQQQIQIQQQNSKMPKGKMDAKPRGRMTAYAFFVQTCREEHKKKHPEETVIFAEFSRKCAERWKTMLDKEKKRFHEMAEKDKKRYDLEMQNYVPPKGVTVGRGKRKKQIKDPNAPKRSLSAFFWFCNDERMKVKAVNPEYGVGDVAKELGRKWSDADPEVKSKYEAMAEKDKARYEREMTEYKLKGKVIQQVPVQMQQQQVPAEEDDDDMDDENE